MSAAAWASGLWAAAEPAAWAARLADPATYAAALALAHARAADAGAWLAAGARLLEASEWCSIFAPVVVYWTYSTLFFAASYYEWSPVVTHRLPTDQKGRFSNRMTVRHVLWTVFLQHVVQIATAFVVAVLLHEDSGPGAVDWRLGVFQLVIGALVIDTYQYWMHRMMHTYRGLYRRFHSVHHQLTVPYAYGALYNHPVEGFLMDTLSGAIGSTVTLMHPWVATVLYTVATIKTVDDHCGFELWWDPFQRLFPNNAAYHDRHHWGKGIRFNYSQPFFTFWDSWCGTQWRDEIHGASDPAAVDAPSPQTAPETPAAGACVRAVRGAAVDSAAEITSDTDSDAGEACAGSAGKLGHTRALVASEFLFDSVRV